MSGRRLSTAARAALERQEGRARDQRARELEQCRAQLRDAERRGAALAASVEDYKTQARTYADEVARLAAALQLTRADAARKGEIAAVAGRCRAQLHDLLEVLDQVDVDPELLHDHEGA